MLLDLVSRGGKWLCSSCCCLMMKLRAPGLHFKQVGLLLLDRCTVALLLASLIVVAS